MAKPKRNHDYVLSFFKPGAILSAFEIISMIAADDREPLERREAEVKEIHSRLGELRRLGLLKWALDSAGVQVMHLNPQGSLQQTFRLLDGFEEPDVVVTSGYKEKYLEAREEIESLRAYNVQVIAERDAALELAGISLDLARSMVPAST